MNIRDEDRCRISSLANALEVDQSEALHMAVSLLLLKVKLAAQNKELVILHKDTNEIYGINYDFNSESE